MFSAATEAPQAQQGDGPDVAKLAEEIVGSLPEAELIRFVESLDQSIEAAYDISLHGLSQTARGMRQGGGEEQQGQPQVQEPVQEGAAPVERSGRLKLG